MARHNRLNSGNDCDDEGGTVVDEEGYTASIAIEPNRLLLGAISLREHLTTRQSPQGYGTKKSKSTREAPAATLES